MQPLVSIVINNYNYGRFLGQAIESALAQTYEHVQVIVVDDGSTDSSREVIDRYRERVTVVLKSNGGQASAFNAGVARAQGAYTLILDADDYLFPNAVESCVRGFPQGYARIFFRLREVDDRGSPLSTKIRTNPFELVDGFVFASPAAPESMVFLGPPTSGNFFDTRILQDVLPIPEHDFRMCAEPFILARTALKGRVRGIDLELGAYRIHGSNAFSGPAPRLSRPDWVRVQVRNYYNTVALRADAYRETGVQWTPPAEFRDFWTLHLLCAAVVWADPDAPRPGPPTLAVLHMIAEHLLRGNGRSTLRAVRAGYLLLLVASPRFFSRAMLRWADNRHMSRSRMVATRDAPTSADA